MNRTKRCPSVEFLEARLALSGISAGLIVGILSLQPAARIPPAPTVVVCQTKIPEPGDEMPIETMSLN